MDSSTSKISTKEKTRAAAAPREPSAAQSTATGGQPAVPGKLTEQPAPTQKAAKTKSAQRTAQLKKGKSKQLAATSSSASSEMDTRMSTVENMLQIIMQRLPAQPDTSDTTCRSSNNSTGVTTIVYSYTHPDPAGTAGAATGYTLAPLSLNIHSCSHTVASSPRSGRTWSWTPTWDILSPSGMNWKAIQCPYQMRFPLLLLNSQ